MVSRRDTLKTAQPIMAGGGKCVQTESGRDSGMEADPYPQR